MNVRNSTFQYAPPFVAIAILLGFSTCVRAATVAGVIRDESGGVVQGAKVVLTEESKGLLYTCTSDNTGSFLFPSVLVGTYTLYAEKNGFRAYQVEGLTVEVGQLASLSITLIVGNLRTVVAVAAPSSTELDSESNTLGVVIDSKRVQALPLNGREFLQLALLVGGAAGISPANNLATSNVGPPMREIVLPGTLPHSTGYSLNGFNLSGARDGELAAGLSVAAIDQFKVHEGFLMPDQGAGPALVNVVTRTGSNQFHGEAFEFLRNRNLDARSFFAAAPEDLKRNQFGFALGGPLWRDRLWFHSFYEGIRELTAFQAAGYSPTPAMFGGVLAETGRAIYDPRTYDGASGQRMPFPGAAIPPSRINPVARGLLEYYLPGSSLASRPSNIFGNPRNTLDDDQGGVRLDFGPSQRHQLSLQFFTQSTAVERPGLYPLSGKLYRNGFTLAALEHTWTISPRVVNTWRAGFLRAVAVGGNQAQTPLLSAIGISNTFGDEGVSAISLQGYSSFGNSTGDVGNRDNTWEIDEQLNYTRSAHQFAFGAGFRYRRGWHQNSNGAALGGISFQPAFTAQLGRDAQGQPAPLLGTGDSFADFLLGLPLTGMVSGLPAVEYRAVELNTFVQDTWRVSRHLTLNLGLSWFLETPPDPQGWGRSAVHGFDTSSGLLVFSSLGQLDPRVASTDRNNLSPRFGLAWKPGSLATVVRAGVGIYDSAMPWILELFPLALGSPSSAGIGFTNPQTIPIPVFQLGQNIFPPAPAKVVSSSYAASLPQGTQVSALDPSFRTTYTTQWNLSIERRISGSDSLDVSYLGSSAHRLPVLTDLSQCRPGPDLFCGAAAKPWPRYGVVYWGTSAGNASSEMLIARYARRTNGGLNLRFDYTFGKTLSDAWESSLTPPRAQIADCRVCDKGPATFDIRNRAVGSVLWDVPYGRGRLAGGWTLSAITTFAAGQPVLFTGPNQTGTVFLNHLPNRVCDGRDSRLSSNIRNNGFLWFDPNCFPVPQAGYFGNSGATVIYGPGVNNWDFGATKLTRLRESMKLQLRVELFNVWNHAQFQQPIGDAGAGANFGHISAALPPRLIQFAAKLLW